MGQTASSHWKKDEDVVACNHCKRDFGTTFRRHHCRGCGKIFCDSCSLTRGEFPARNVFTPERLCAGCASRRGFEKMDARTSCATCTKPFGESVSKEQCKNCGKLNCGDCAPPSKDIPVVPKGVRICEACAVSLRELQTMAKAEVRESSQRNLSTGSF